MDELLALQFQLFALITVFTQIYSRLHFWGVDTSYYTLGIGAPLQISTSILA